MNKPRLLQHFVPVRSSSGDSFLLTEGRHVWIQAGAESDILPLLDGTRTMAEVAMSVSGQYSLTVVLNAIKRLDKLGVLGDGTSDLPAAELAYWDAAGVAPALVVERREQAPVVVTALGGADASAVVGALAADGLRVVEQSASDVAASAASDAGVHLVVADDYQHADIDALNRHFFAAGRPWMLVNPRGVWPWVGPLFVPETTGCWACLDSRVDSNRMVQGYLRKFGGVTEFATTSVAALPSSVGLIASLAATEVSRFVGTGSAPAIEGRLLALDLTTLELTPHELIRLPQCPVCGDPSIMDRGAKVSINFSPINFSADGGFRSSRPEDTFARLEKHVSPITGAVSWLEPMHKDPEGLCHAYNAGHNFAMLRNSMDALKRNLRGNSGGKGSTDIQAKVSAVCEAVERFSGVWHEDRPVVKSVHARLDGRSVLPNELMLFHDRQFEERDETNADPRHRLHQVPEPFDLDMEISWSEAWSMTNDEPVFVPAAYAWFGHPDSARRFFTYSDGNGNASGNNLEEAILQGFCEVVERDAVGIWWYNRLRYPQVDLASFEDPYIDSLLGYYERMGRKIWMLDLTTDMGIPTFAVVSHCVGHTSDDVLVAFGAHFDARLAALRALTETNQFLPAVTTRDERGNTVYAMDDFAAVDWWTTASVTTDPWLLPADVPAIDASTYVTPQLGSVGEYVQLCVERASNLGFEVLVLDQTRPDLELSVAKVMVPGMRHFWRRLAPGRLFDLPVEMGWAAEQTAWEDVNHRSVFF